jgi:hypothetical protein
MISKTTYLQSLSSACPHAMAGPPRAATLTTNAIISTPAKISIISASTTAFSLICEVSSTVRRRDMPMPEDALSNTWGISRRADMEDKYCNLRRGKAVLHRKVYIEESQKKTVFHAYSFHNKATCMRRAPHPTIHASLPIYRDIKSHPLYHHFLRLPTSSSPGSLPSSPSRSLSHPTFLSYPSRCKTTITPINPNITLLSHGCSDSKIVTYPTPGTYPLTLPMISVSRSK